MTKKLNLLVLPSIENFTEIIGENPSNIDLTKGYYKNLEYIFEEGKAIILHSGKDIKEFDSVWLSSFWGSRDLAYTVKMYLSHNKVHHTFVEMSTSKLSDQMIFILNGIKTPNTYFAGSNNLLTYVQEIETICLYPLIVKDTKGYRGRYSTYIENRKQLIETLSNLQVNRRFFFQSYIPNEYDWGVLVVNGDVVSAEKSFSKPNEFRNNSARGAKEVFVELKDIPDVIKKIAVESSKLLNLSWSRADIIIDKNTGLPYLLEVNRSPGITAGTTEVSGAREFLEAHIKSII